jgi:DNA polymerase delta subunit 1
MKRRKEEEAAEQQPATPGAAPPLPPSPRTPEERARKRARYDARQEFTAQPSPIKTPASLAQGHAHRPLPKHISPGFDFAATRLKASECNGMGRPEPTEEQLLAWDAGKDEFLFQITTCKASYVSPKHSNTNRYWFSRLNGYGQVPVQRMYGVTETGQSVCVNVWGFSPYLFINAPVGTTDETFDDDETIERLGTVLERLIEKHQARRKKQGFGGGWQASRPERDETLIDDAYVALDDDLIDGHGPVGGLDRLDESDDDEDDDDDHHKKDASELISRREPSPDDFLLDLPVDEQTQLAALQDYEESQPAVAAAPGETRFELRKRGDPIGIEFAPPAALRELPMPSSSSSSTTQEEQRDPDKEYGPRVVGIFPERYTIAEHWQPNKTMVYRVALRTPNMIPVVRDAIGSGPTQRNPRPSALGKKVHIYGPTYESGIRFENRFMLDHGIVGTGWVGLKPGQYRLTPLAERVSRCTLEVDVFEENVQGYDVNERPDLYDGKPCRMRKLDYDIECLNTDGQFPIPTRDAVINIHGVGCEIQWPDKIIADVAFVLGSAAPISGDKAERTRTVCFATERELLNGWAEFLNLFDPDVIGGYNILNFDNKYLLERAKVIGATRLLEVSRVLDQKVEGRVEKRQSKNLGNSERFVLQCEGRVFIDMLPYVKDNLYEKMRSYTLNAVAATLLNDQKDDVDHTQIPILHMGSDQDRKRIGDYCRKDVLLAKRLADKLMSHTALSELSRVQRVQLDQQQNGGASFKVFAQLLHHFRKRGFIVPYRQFKKTEYKGATVFPPERGYYNDEPVVTLDFGSLYPSLAIAHNTCTTTHVLDRDKEAALDAFGLGDAWRAARDAGQTEEMRRIENELFYVCPVGHRYVRSKHFEGVFPAMEKELLALRQNAKNLLKKATDEFLKKVYDQRQNSIKISANSGYGFHGLPSNGVYWFWVAESITAGGRDQIQATKEYIEEYFTLVNGYPGNAKVLYGDTDSVMVIFGLKIADPKNKAEVTATLERAIKIGKEAAAYCTAKFAPPNTLNFEALCWPYLLITKKRYGGQLWLNPNAPEKKLKIKGLESARRDNCKLVANTQKHCLELILTKGTPDEAVVYAQRQIRALLEGKVDVHELIITQQLKCYQKDYKTKQAHAHVRELMEKRSPGSGPKIGERVPYVLVRRDKKAKRYECAENPLFAVENNLPIHTAYYLENQMFKPLIRVLTPIYGEEKAHRLITTGEHTRHIDRHIALQEDEGLGKFFTKSVMCKGCGITLSYGTCAEGSRPAELLCRSCEPRRFNLLVKEQAKYSAVQAAFHRMWTTCQDCQGSRFTEIMCSAQDCPIFFRRLTARRDMETSKKTVQALAKELEW